MLSLVFRGRSVKRFLSSVDLFGHPVVPRLGLLSR